MDLDPTWGFGKIQSVVLDMEARIRELEAAMRQSMTCIDDWLNIYASEMCNEQRVKEALERVGARGTLAYIAGVQEINRAALAFRR